MIHDLVQERRRELPKAMLKGNDWLKMKCFLSVSLWAKSVHTTHWLCNHKSREEQMKEKIKNWCRPWPAGSFVVAAIYKYTWTTESCGEKGMARPLFQEESAPTLAWTGFYCFSGHITLRMILIYSAQVCFRRLQKTKERMLLIT